MSEGKSPAEIERHAEEVREQMAGTAERLRERLSPGQLFEEVTHYLKHSDGAVSLSNLQSQVRDNPMAVALVGTGLAWLMFGSGSDGNGRGRRPDGAGQRRGGGRTHAASQFTQPDSSLDRGPVPAHPFESATGSGSGAAAGLGDTARSYAGSVREAASESYDQVSSAAGEAYRGVRDGAAELGSRVADGGRDFAEGVSDVAGRVADGSRDAARGARHAFEDLLEREPLVLGAIGLAVGAALGALAPRTRIEDEYLGETGDRVKRSAAEAVREGMEEAKDVAEKAYAAGKEALGSKDGAGSSSLGAKIENAAGAAADAVEKETAARAGEPGKPATGRF